MQCKFLEIKAVKDVKYWCRKLDMDVSHRVAKCGRGDCLLFQPKGSNDISEATRAVR